MRVLGLNGRTYHLKVQDYRVDWDRKVSGPQKRIKDVLRPYWDRPGVVVTEETSLPGCGGKALRMDLMNWNRRIAIEVSPRSSHSFNAFFHRSRVGFGAAVGRDLAKAEWAEANKWTLIELDDDAIAAFSATWVAEHYDLAL